MLTIIGGTYREMCLAPSWDQLMGSGMRAAAGTALLVQDCKKANPRLISWINPAERQNAEFWSESFEIEATFHERKNEFRFQYDHGLSVPKLYVEPEDIEPVTPQVLEADEVLRFGLIEDPDSRIRVKASSIVYDPQGGHRAVPYSKSSSKADRVAIIANLVEATEMLRALGRLSHIDRSEIKPVAYGRELLSAENADVVIIKNGAEGAFVFTPVDHHHVSSFKTGRVFKIGSGDMFSAVFASYWLMYESDPLEAAQRASAAVAYYCNYGGLNGLRIPPGIESLFGGEIEEHYIPPGSSTRSSRQVYIAGPLFNFQQQWFVEEVHRCLSSQGVKCFSPYHDVGLAANGAHEDEMKRIAADDITGLENSAAVFAIVDGLDAGTMFEIGYAAARGIPVVAFGQCVRKEDLLMLLGSPTCKVFEDFPTAIYHAAWLALESS